MKNAILVILSLAIIVLGFALYNQTSSDIAPTPRTRDSQVNPRPTVSSDAKPSTPSPAESRRAEEEAQRLDEAQRILDGRERNNRKIETLVKSRKQLNRATIDLIHAIRDSGDPNASERLEDPKIQGSIDHIKEIEEDLSETSMNNYKLKLDWDIKKSRLPTELRFSDPEFFKCSILTDWKIESH